MSNWIGWNGGECPMKLGVQPDWRLRNGLEYKGSDWPNFKLDWSHDPEDPEHDIVAYCEAQS